MRADPADAAVRPRPPSAPLTYHRRTFGTHAELAGPGAAG
jgi:hypothetical protein